LTKKLQPLDLSVNKSFKSKMCCCCCWEQWMVTGKHDYTRTKKIKGILLESIQLLVHGWSGVSAEFMFDVFRKS